jgi:competence CoiA-like predicted nuclease
LFNKLYFKKHLAAKKPILYLHPAIEKKRPVLKNEMLKAEKFSKESLPQKLSAVSLPSASEKKWVALKRKCKKQRNFRKKIGSGTSPPYLCTPV